MIRTPAAEAVTELILETFRLNGRLLSAGDRLTRSMGQSSARWQVLGAVSAQPLTVPEIARSMGLTRQSVQRTTDLLEADGLLELVENPGHRRSRRVALTARGQLVYSKIDMAQVDWSNRLARGLQLRDLRSALETLRALRARLEAGKRGGFR